MQQTWANRMLDTQEQVQAFRQIYYEPVYDKAASLTGNADRAQELTEQVFSLMQERFAGRVLPRDSLIYMKAQITLMYDRAYADLAPDMQPTLAVKGNVGGQAAQEMVSKRARVYVRRKKAPMSVVNQEEAACRVSVEKTAEMAEPDVVVKSDAQAEPRAAAKPETKDASPVSEEHAPEQEGVYNEQITAMWTPGQRFDLDELDAQKEIAESIPDEQPSEKRSVSLSLINTALVLVLIAAIVFVLAEFGVVPRLF